MKAQRKPAAVISPAYSRAVSYASGIMVSACMARIAPAATAVAAAINSGLAPVRAKLPTNAAVPDRTAIPPHTPKM